MGLGTSMAGWESAYLGDRREGEGSVAVLGLAQKQKRSSAFGVGQGSQKEHFSDTLKQPLSISPAGK